MYTDEAGRPLLANECLQSHVDGEHTVTYYLHLNEVRSLSIQNASFAFQYKSMYVSAWEFPWRTLFSTFTFLKAAQSTQPNPLDPPLWLTSRGLAVFSSLQVSLCPLLYIWRHLKSNNSKCIKVGSFLSCWSSSTTTLTVESRPAALTSNLTTPIWIRKQP